MTFRKQPERSVSPPLPGPPAQDTHTRGGMSSGARTLTLGVDELGARTLTLGVDVLGAACGAGVSAPGPRSHRGPA